MYRRLRQAFRKNSSELKALLLGQMPGFVLGRREDTQNQMPVFVFHERLPGKRARHFCYPWLESAPLADRLAVEVGYRTVHYGPVLPRQLSSDDPLRVRRLPEEYLFTLPGSGRASLWSVWQDRLRGFARRLHPATP